MRGCRRDSVYIEAKVLDIECLNQAWVFGLGQSGGLRQMIDAEQLAMLVDDRCLIAHGGVDCKIFVQGHMKQQPGDTRAAAWWSLVPHLDGYVSGDCSFESSGDGGVIRCDPGL